MRRETGTDALVLHVGAFLGDKANSKPKVDVKQKPRKNEEILNTTVAERSLAVDHFASPGVGKEYSSV